MAPTGIPLCGEIKPQKTPQGHPISFRLYGGKVTAVSPQGAELLPLWADVSGALGSTQPLRTGRIMGTWEFPKGKRNQLPSPSPQGDHIPHRAAPTPRGVLTPVTACE